MAKVFFHSHLGITINKKDLDCTHKIDKSSGPIIVKFVQHNLKNQVYNRFILFLKITKKKNLFYNSIVTSKRISYIQKLFSLKEVAKINSYWTFNGKSFYTLVNNPNKKILLNLNKPDKVFNNIKV